MRLKLLGWLSMNNKGQVLIIFILLIPILLLGAAYVVDNIYISYHTNKLNGINSMISSDISTNNIDIIEISDYVKKNDKNISVEVIVISDTEVKINLSKKINSLFGAIIGKNFYTLSSSKTAKIIKKDAPIYQ